MTAHQKFIIATPRRPFRFRSKVPPDAAGILRVIKTVAAVTGVKPSDFTGHCRSRAVSYARHLAVATVAREFPGLVYAQLAEIFHRKHTTVLNSLRSHQWLLRMDARYQELHARLIDQLTTHL